MRFPLPHRWRFSALASVVTAAVALCSGTGVRAVAADWPNWRGPNHNGVSAETGCLATWLKEGPKRLWTKSVGVGYSSVAVSGGRVYTMGNQRNTDIVWCLNAETGEEVWKHTYPCGAGSYPGTRATPTVDGKNVYTISRDGHLFCLRADSGEVVWSKNVRKDLGARVPGYGFAGSPLVAGRLLILNVGSAGVALDKATGRVVWKSGGGAAGYATPVPFEMGGRKCVAIFCYKSVVVLNAMNGEQLGRHHWKTNQYDVNAADPIISGDKMFISSGYNTGCALLRIGKGKTTVLWQNRKMRNHFNGCVLWKGHIYGFDESTFKCLDFQSGAVKWSQRRLGRQGSVTIADGKLVIMDGRGTLILAEASPAGYKELARTKVLSGTCWTVPVVSGGRIYCRSHEGELVCVRVGPKPTPTKPKPTPPPVAARQNKLTLARAYLKAGLKEKAKALLLDIVRNHKGSEHARQAQRLLDSIK